MGKLLIKHGTIVSMSSERGVIKDGYLLVEDGLISELGDVCDLPLLASSDALIDADGSVVIPGIIDAHAHPAEYMIREVTDELLDGEARVRRWILPLYENMTPDVEAMATRMFLEEAASCGTTVVADPMMMNVGSVLEEVAKVNVRVVAGALSWSLRDRIYTEPKDALAALRRIEDESSRRREMVIPLASAVDVVNSSYELLETLAVEANEKGLIFTSHFGFSRNELDLVRKAGFDVERVLIARVVGMPVEDAVKAAGEGAGFVACPYTCMSNGGGLGRRGMLPELSQLGARVALGSGGLSSPGSTDMLRVAGLAALAFKDSRFSTSVVDAWWALSAVTAQAADVLGLDKAGRFDEGSWGDAVILDPRLRGSGSVVGDPLVYAVYRGGCHHVKHVIIGGRTILEYGKFVKQR